MAHIQIPSDLWGQTRIRAFETGTTATNIVIEALRAYLNGSAAKTPPVPRTPPAVGPITGNLDRTREYPPVLGGVFTYNIEGEEHATFIRQTAEVDQYLLDAWNQLAKEPGPIDGQAVIKLAEKRRDAKIGTVGIGGIIEKSHDEDGVRVIDSVKLLEVSVVDKERVRDLPWDSTLRSRAGDGPETAPRSTGETKPPSTKSTGRVVTDSSTAMAAAQEMIEAKARPAMPVPKPSRKTRSGRSGSRSSSKTSTPTDE